MVATPAQARDAQVAMRMLGKEDHRAFRSLPPEARAAVLIDWLTIHVGLGPADLEALGNALSCQAWAMHREGV